MDAERGADERTHALSDNLKMPLIGLLDRHSNIPADTDLPFPVAQ